MTLFAKLTKKNCCVCPYCGYEEATYIDGDEESCYQCDNCGEDYYILFNSNSWDESIEDYAEIEDVTDHHRFSLLEE